MDISKQSYLCLLVTLQKIGSGRVSDNFHRGIQARHYYYVKKILFSSIMSQDDNEKGVILPGGRSR